MRKTDWKAIRKEYEYTNMTMKQIAKSNHIKYSTLRMHKSRNKWKRKPKGKSHSHSSKHVTMSHKNVTPNVTLKNGKKINLTPKDFQFCELVAIKRMPLYKAYKIAFNCKSRSKSSLTTLSSRLYRNAKIRLTIVDIQKDFLREHGWDSSSLINELTWFFEQSKASVIKKGVNKSNTDSAYNALNLLIDIGNLNPIQRAKTRKIEAESSIKQIQAKQMSTSNNKQASQMERVLKSFEIPDNDHKE